jgi:GPI mannosyltransferase 3
MISLLGICLLALLLRLWVGIHSHYLIHPDEIFDYLEQGFRLAFGYGTQAWTYEDGVRSYLFPAIIAAVMRLGALFGPAPGYPIGAVFIFMSLLSTSVVAVAFMWGWRMAGRPGAWVTAGISTIWFELIYFAPHAMSEVIATDFLVVAVCLYPLSRDRCPTRARLWWLGICLGLTIVFRLQLLPAALVIGAWLIAQHGWRVASQVAMIMAIPVMGVGLLDWVTYDYPFQSFILNIWANTAGGAASYYGRQPFYYFLDLETHYLGGILGLIAVAGIVGGIRIPLLLAIPISILAAHSLIGHKEYRFIYPALPFVFVLTGIATTRLITLLAPERRSAQYGLAALFMALWSFASLAQAIEGPFRREWFRESGTLAAARFIAALPDVCGIGTYVPPAALPGNVLIAHDVPIYFNTSPQTFSADSRAFNVLITAEDQMPPDNAFELAGCWANGFNEGSLNVRKPAACVLTRHGICQGGAITAPVLPRPPGW